MWGWGWANKWDYEYQSNSLVDAGKLQVLGMIQAWGNLWSLDTGLLEY